MSSRWRLAVPGWVGRVLLGAAMLVAVTVLIGRPTVFSDTDDYYAEGHGVVRALQKWVVEGRPPFDLSEAGYRLSDPAGADEEPVHNQDGARSVYYGLMLYLLQAAGTLWLLTAAQAAWAAGLVHAVWRRVSPRGRTRDYLGLMAVLALGSTLPVFTGFAMPDVFAAFAALSAVLVLVYGDQLGRWAKAALWASLAASLNFHGSNLLTTVAVTGIGLAGLFLARTDWRRIAWRAAFVAGAVAVAVLAGKAYALAIKLRTGDDLGRPPFLTARVLADGPGRDYLAQACGKPYRFEVCYFQGLPLTNTEDILWQDDPAQGIFNSHDYPTRVRLVRQDAAFALAAVAREPLVELKAALANWGAQLRAVELDEPLRDQGFYLADPYWSTTNLRRLILEAGPCDPRQGTCAIRSPRTGSALWTGGVAAIALMACAGLGAMLLRGRKALDAVAERGLWAMGLLLAAIPVNAAVCGMLSGPFARYEMRMLWLIPLAALLLWTAWRRPVKS